MCIRDSGIHDDGRGFCVAPSVAANVMFGGGTGLRGRTSLLAMTWNDTGKVLRFFVDGVQVAERTYTGTAATSTLYLGSYDTISGYGLSGVLRAAALYNRALTASEVLSASRRMGGKAGYVIP